MLSSMLRKFRFKSVYRAALRKLTSPVMSAGENLSTAPCMSTFAREFAFEDRPTTVPSMLWMPAEKFGCTARSAKLACPACSTIFLIAIGIGARAAAGAGPAATWPETALPGAGLARGAAGGGVGAGARAGAPPGGPREGAGATTVAPGPDNTRFTFKLVSGSMMTRAYSL